MVVVVVGVGLPAEMLDDHGVCAFVSEAGGGLAEEEVSAVAVVSQQVVLQLDVHLLQSDVDVLDFLE